jgi:hypothetical protein
MNALRDSNCSALYAALVADVDALCETARSWQTVRDVHEAVERARHACDAW